jgi:hypothetical protein
MERNIVSAHVEHGQQSLYYYYWVEWAIILTGCAYWTGKAYEKEKLALVRADASGFYDSRLSCFVLYQTLYQR